MQKTSPLSHEMIERVEAMRDWVRNHYEPESIGEYESIDGKLDLLDTILKSGWIESHETYKLQSLGVTLGDVFVQEMGFNWIQVEDEYGTDPAINLPGTTIILFPLTMISKRIEKGEEVDIREFYDGLKEKVEEVKRKAD